MADRRFIKSTESPTRHGRAAISFDEGKLKELTGGDTVPMRDMWGKPIAPKIAAHIWFGANDRPDIRAEAEPVWDRVKTIPFNVTFTGDDADRNLAATLEAEKAGILNWIIEGAVKWWQASKGATRSALRDVPHEVKEATDAWRSDNDLFAQFINDECITGPRCEVLNERLYKAYRAWWARSGFRESDPRFLSADAVGRRLAADGYEATKTKHGRGRRGIELKNIYNDAGDEPPPAPF
jgi:putative DNA primase/helicase